MSQSVPLLEIQALRVRFGLEEPWVLDGVSLQVNPGDTVALVGPSGSGKTTLLSHAAGLREAASGEVLFEGKALAQMSSARLDALRAEKIGFVFQRALLLPFLSVRENVALALEPLGAARRVALESQVDPLLARMGLAQLGERPAASLSVGEAQRVAVARAMIKGPKLLLADEPTGALDSVAVQAVLDLLLVRGPAPTCAVLVATHDARVASRCRRVLTLAGGRLQ